MLSQLGWMSPVVRHRLPPTAGAHSQTASQPYWQKRIDDRPAGGLERLVHFVVSGNHQPHLRGLVVGRLLLHHGRDEAAQVVLQIVDAPRGVKLRILHLVIQRARIAGAGLAARATE